jgi:HAD superfamily hydrolase (TIGR01662 family)
MKEEDLSIIHTHMKEQIEKTGASIDKIYFCPDVESTSFNRKPNPGMAWQAAKDNQDIDFSRSVMVGNKLSDMRFGRAAGMYTVFIPSTNPEQQFPHPDIDLKFTSLLAFAEAL